MVKNRLSLGDYPSKRRLGYCGLITQGFVVKRIQLSQPNQENVAKTQKVVLYRHCNVGNLTDWIFDWIFWIYLQQRVVHEETIHG